MKKKDKTNNKQKKLKRNWKKMGSHKCKNAMILFPAFCNNNNKPISSLSHLLHWKKNSKNNNKEPQLFISQIKLWNNWYLKHLGSNLWQWYKCNQVNGLKKISSSIFPFLRAVGICKCYEYFAEGQTFVCCAWKKSFQNTHNLKVRILICWMPLIAIFRPTVMWSVNRSVLR